MESLRFPYYGKRLLGLPQDLIFGVRCPEESLVLYYCFNNLYGLLSFIMTIPIFMEPDVGTLHLPRILCLHGGGTNAKIFHAQCRVLRAELKGIFRLCFAEAPFPSKPGPVSESGDTFR